MRLQNMTIRNKGAHFRHPPCHVSSPSLSEKKRLFAAAARALVAYWLDGKVEIHLEDIRVEYDAIENCGAIFIHERISEDPEFQRMLEQSSCISELKILASLALRNVTSDFLVKH